MTKISKKPITWDGHRKGRLALGCGMIVLMLVLMVVYQGFVMTFVGILIILGGLKQVFVAKVLDDEALRKVSLGWRL